MYIRKIMFLYCIYCCYILLLDSYMEATICRKKDSACMCIESRAEDFLHSPDNFCTLLPMAIVAIPILLKFSIKTMNYTFKDKSQTVLLFWFYLEVKCFTLAYKLVKKLLLKMINLQQKTRTISNKSVQSLSTFANNN